jgi:hypothetical protein
VDYEFVGERRTFEHRVRTREVHMKLVKRVAVALGSLLAVAMAGGAHWRW